MNSIWRVQRCSWVVCVCVVLYAVGSVQAQWATNVLLFIGDGMGFAQVEAGRCYTGSNMVFEAWPHQGEVTTHSANAAVTDSAASATAMATGHKVNNGVLSLAIPGDGAEYETVLEFLQRRGKRTGLVTTTFIAHATPAAFAAHETSRNNYTQIAADYMQQSLPHVLLGGGGFGMSVAGANVAGYTCVTNRASMQAMDVTNVVRVSGQFGSGHMPYEYSGPGDLPHLSEMTQTALDILENSTNGFFLMVEGGRIDHACHANDITNCVRETAEFDHAVRVGMAWASNRTDTMVLVTADHECGGLTVLADNGPGIEPDVSWASISHTGTNVGIYAWGVGAGMATGVIDNTDVYRIMLKTQTIVPTARNIENTGHGATSTWNVKPEEVCCLEMSDGLSPTSWSPIATVTSSTHVLAVTDTNLSGVAARFYRLRAFP